MKFQIKEQINKALQALSKQQREVIILRFGLDGKKKRVLQEIADEHMLTRERIRQIQKKAIEQLQTDVCVKELAAAANHVNEALRTCGGVADEEAICLACDAGDKTEQNYIHLLLVVSGNFYLSPETNDIQKYWYAEEKSKKAIDTVLFAMHKKFEQEGNNLMNEDNLNKIYDEIAAPYKGLVPDCIPAVKLSRRLGANPLGEWGIKEHPEIALSGLSGYIRSVLRDAGKPLHFREIAKRVGQLKEDTDCNVYSCHNELVRQDDFILVGRGLYALNGMGYRPGTIADIIKVGIKENGPMTRDEVINFVNGERHVKTQSIVLTLGKKNLFAKDAENKYFLVV